MFSPEKEVNAKPSPPTEEPPGRPLLLPAVPPTLELGLTVAYTLLYTFVFAFVYVQLWLILHRGHKRVSHRSALLFLCLLWAALRTALFSFYFGNAARGADRLQPLPRWLLYCCPRCLQFFTLCLLNLYFAQLMFKAKAKYSPELTKYKVPLRLVFLCLSVFFLVVNLTCALLIQSALERSDPASAGGVRRAVLARVLVNDGLFVLCAVSLSVCIFRIAKMSSANVYLESKGTSVRQATAIGVLVILLFTSRACYNLVVVGLSPEGPATPFSYGWFSVSDQADVREVRGETYVVFGVVLLLWELLPTSLLVGFFRVQKPNQNLTAGGIINSQSFSSRAYLFDNPRRYDSEDDLTRSITSRSDRTSLLSTTPQTVLPTWYGSFPRTGSLTGVGGHPPAFSHHASASRSANGTTSTAATTSTAPLVFAYPDVQGHHQHHHNLYSTPQNNGCRHYHHHHHHPQQHHHHPQQHHHHPQQHHHPHHHPQQPSSHCSTPQNHHCGSQNYYCTPTH